ncbi:MAG TPA: ParB/RepB/Spo0J family partition protein [Gaiellaceae bacterium]|jgi:ParB/RepB/Spo0J family partition protein
MDQITMIPVDKVVEPRHPVRTRFDEDALDELSRSIRENGIRSPLRVFPLEGGTYEVRFGHRRLLAARIVGLAELPCIVDDVAATIDADRILENADRDDVAPTDEARYFARLMLENGNDVDKVCALARRPRGYVEGRLLLLQGDELVFAALEAGTITLGVASELNRFTREEGRRFHLDFAIRTGATVAQVREWRTRDNATPAVVVTPAAASPVVAPAVPGPASANPYETPYAAMAPTSAFSQSLEPRSCVFCQRTEQEYRMFRVFVCAEDAQRYLAPLEKAAKA